jgi:Predicted hydrolases or acyltransferases (alpha/beta hydrolase superfamily)
MFVWGRATAAVKDNSLCSERPHPQLKRVLLCHTPSRGNDGLPRNFVQRDQHRIYVRDHPGAEPAIILMHGFPDNVHLYDRLSPYLSPPRRVVLFDFLGWGSSDKPSGYPYTTDNQVGDLDAVITQLGLGQVVLVAHDASGPPAIDWALATPSAWPGWCC